MEIRLQDLRRYAIERRTEITAVDSASGRRFVINTSGQVRIPDEDKDFRVEAALEGADRFEVGAAEKTRRLNRESLARELSEHFGKGAKTTSEDEED
jgi:hypothetical protein